jgi:hypothetical protein
MSRGGLVTLPGGAVAHVGRRETSGLTLGKRHSLTRSTTGNTLEVGTANVTIAGLVLVVLRTGPFLEARRRVHRILGFTSTVRSC